MARPRIPIEWATVDKLCELHCTASEIAGILNIAVDTLERAIKREHKVTFSEYFEQKSAFGRRSLRRKQYELAMKGNPTMLVWLGKQWLGQKDKNTHEHSGPDGKPMETKVTSIDKSDDELKSRAIELGHRLGLIKESKV